MFAEKQKLVADLEAFGPGGKVITSSQTKTDTDKDPLATETSKTCDPADEPWCLNIIQIITFDFLTAHNLYLFLF